MAEGTCGIVCEGPWAGRSMVAYAPAQRHATVDWARLKGISFADLAQVGLVTKDQHNMGADRFRDRLMLPIQDGRGRIVAFTGLRHPGWIIGKRGAGMVKHSNDGRLSGNRGIVRRRQGKQAPAAHFGAQRMVREPLDVNAVTRAGKLLGTGGSADRPIVPLASCGTGPTMRQLGMIRGEQGGKLSSPMLCFGANEAGRADTARMWTMLQPGERMTACGLILLAEPTVRGRWSNRAGSTNLPDA